MLLLYQIPPMKLLSTLVMLSAILWVKMMISPTSRINPIKIK
uniref:Atp8 protein n=1 Tax=Trichinella nelsoni TaxID=6336 RepID=A0A0A0V591_9BILA|nr:ATP synthase F0 subunit 8 [Trichinella nelsoni]AIW57017.1 ATP synthase F0 subunit 8 [Trichinella nelsoni]